MEFDWVMGCGLGWVEEILPTDNSATARPPLLHIGSSHAQNPHFTFDPIFAIARTRCTNLACFVIASDYIIVINVLKEKTSTTDMN